MEHTVQRPRQGSEREMLQSHLDFLRNALISKLDGLDRETVGNHLAPSLTTLLGLVKHSTDVQEHWFRVMMKGEKILLTYYREEDEYADWRIEPDNTVHSVIAAYREASSRADQAVAACSLDETAEGCDRNLRWIYLNVIYDMARHSGHADIAPELTDGAIGK